ncbi:hypothetical protein [Desulfobacula sp.]|uniref:hypothetical protein n=1 Tax=Desulfobacula sp. TaxID=2593537 RepID=UPI0026330C98|nr:hypothetical protein [Desulfobacula sp.]
MLYIVMAWSIISRWRLKENIVVVTAKGTVEFAREFATFSPSVAALFELRFKSLDRLAFVGTPCQINIIEAI